MDTHQERIDQLSRTLAAGNSRRGILRALGVGAASGLLAVVGHEAMAGERPHQHLQGRSKQRNHKQRNNRNKNQVKDQDNNGGGNSCQAGCQEAFEGCTEPCGGSPSSLEFCVGLCNDRLNACKEKC
jgi:hypothetical protein